MLHANEMSAIPCKILAAASTFWQCFPWCCKLQRWPGFLFWKFNALHARAQIHFKCGYIFLFNSCIKEIHVCFRLISETLSDKWRSAEIKSEWWNGRLIGFNLTAYLLDNHILARLKLGPFFDDAFDATAIKC